MRAIFLKIFSFLATILLFLLSSASIHASNSSPIIVGGGANTITPIVHPADLSGYVPYVGATTDVNLGSHTLKLGRIVDDTVSSVVSVDPNSRFLENSSNKTTVDWGNSQLVYNGGLSSGTSLNWQSHQLLNSSFATTFDWDSLSFPTLTSDGVLVTSGGAGAISVDTGSYLKGTITSTQVAYGQPGGLTGSSDFIYGATSKSFDVGWAGTNYMHISGGVTKTHRIGSSAGTNLQIAEGTSSYIFNNLPGKSVTGTGIVVSDSIGTLGTISTSAGISSIVSDETGSGALVFGTSPSLTTPTLGAATATTINKITLTQPATGATLTIVDGKTLTASNSITLAGTDTTTMTFPTTSATIARTDTGQTFTGSNTFSGTTTSVQTTNFTSTSTTVTLGSNAAASTLGLGTGATTTGVTKAVNIGTGGLTGSTTNVVIGTTTGTNNTVQINGNSGSTAITLNGNTTVGNSASFTTTGTVSLDTVTNTNTVSINSGATTTGNTATVNIGAGATASGGAKVIHIGDASLAGSTTTITMGSTAGTSTDTINGQTFHTGGVAMPYVAKTANYTVNAATDWAIDCTANTFTVSLPNAAALVGTSGPTFVVTNSGAGVITVTTVGGTQIVANDAITTLQTLAAGISKTFQSTGTGYRVY